ncbi:Protein of unknown function DUF1042 [Plasmopara halstedii]|uniref:Spermatogenesis-associated protein 4 n=1 Tax=Plasmopara halstedii TaxID=4781 RepID=A0A0N7L7G7_PLAHL|nr:Protein of unknown function DUF1042 [Plasmopara halstedii]CEG47027.1 Protein of unknown function DUF1042 [Plasmopara halstedii]|eukprot:XP_024583396.1 Protein of unknown function DUF1042 [Plasmopara halstedii]
MTEDSRSNKLNRELLRWIQSLDLAYSIKNVKRDFANGFLVAEILSRYYDKDISMHSYENGIGKKARKDNWDQLVKVFGRFVDLEPLIIKNDIDAVIHCQNGAAVAFLTKLYQCLTKRTIQSTLISQPHTSGTDDNAACASIARSLKTLEEIPPYAKPTNSTLIRDKMRESNLAETQDQTQLHRKVREIYSQHEEMHQLERLMVSTPEHNSALNSASKATMLRGATKAVCNEGSTPVLITQQIVREVQIKTANHQGFDKLRATREAKETGLLDPLDSRCNNEDARRDLAYCRVSSKSDTYSMETAHRRRPFDLLNEKVERLIFDTELTLRPHEVKEKFEWFINAAYEGQWLNEQQFVNVFQCAQEEAELLGLGFLDFPRDFWKFIGLMYPFLSEYDESHVFFQTAINFFVLLGQQCACREKAAASLLMPEYMLPKLTTILRRDAIKRPMLLRTVYAFVPNTVLAHIQTIKYLREAMADNIPLFIHILTILVGMESELDETLVDLYYYYCSIGLDTPCEKLRAACLSMLMSFLNYDVKLVADLLPRLTRFSSRHAWWEVKAQLVIIASALLRVASPQQKHEEDDADGSIAISKISTNKFSEQIELCLTIIEREFHPKASLNMRRIGLSSLSQNLERYQELVPLFVDVLLSLPVAVRHTMLATANTDPSTESTKIGATGIEHQLPIRGASGVIYQLVPLITSWDSVAIAKQLYYEHQTSIEADSSVLHVMFKCFEHLLNTGKQSNVWLLYDQMKDYIVTGFVKATTCELSASIVTIALTALRDSETDVFQHIALVKSVRQVITMNNEDLRQQTIVKILQNVRNTSPVRAKQVQRFVTTMRSKCDADTYKSSLFSTAFGNDV